jgi:3-deoxy-manno-octulosonate cytidylyltransferase (CMP-KDO synthetase)
MDIAKWPDDAPLPVYHHVGVYAYRPQALQNYMAWDESTLEQLEGLEQLRFLANGETVKCVEVDGRGRVFWELNNPEDVARIESVIGEAL